MSEITYDEFEKMEKLEKEDVYENSKCTIKDLLRELLEERPYTISELVDNTKDSLCYSSIHDGDRIVRSYVKELIEEGMVESKIGKRRIVYFGLKKNPSQ